MKKGILLFLFGFLCTLVWGQSIANYAFTSNITSSLEDLTTGSTSLLTGNQDDAATVVTAIGFDFFYGGVRYTHFSANSNGQMRLHTSSGATAIGSGGITTYTASTATLFPMSGDNEVNDGIKYKVIGSTPGSRKLVVEWTQFYAYYTNLTNAGNMQAWLDEATGTVTYVYGEIYNSSSGTVSSGIALSFSNTATTARYVTVAASPTSTAAATITTNTFEAGSGTATGSPLIANLGTSTANARRAYIFTPSNTTAPTSLTFSSVGISSMTLNWADNASDEVGYAIYYSTDATNYTYYTTTAANAVSQNVTGLLGGTTYYWKVYALRETIGSPVTGTQATSACASYSGTISVGPTGTFSNLTTAISTLNACGYTGNIILELQSTYVSTGETFPLTFTSSLGSNASKTITIRPATGATGLAITSANTTGTINLNGASYITFDGRPGGSGAKDMVIANTNLGTSYAVQFINDANNNAFNYCKINSRNNSTSSGTIVFSTTTGANGNDNNTIDNCDIYDGTSTPYNAIYASGTTTTATHNNSNNTISNCNVYNFSYLGGSAYGIYLGSGNTDWTINANSFYQTSTRTKTTGATDYVIYISNTGNSFTISNNFIGGSSASCGGTAWTVAGAVTNKFVAIYSSPSTTGTTSIQGNTINNFDFSTTSGTTTGAGSFCGISISGGNANIGNTTGNVFGSSTVDKIKLTATNAALLVGIYTTSSATVNISNNTIYGMTSVGSAAGTGAYLYGISAAGSAAYTISNNTIGSTTVANSMRAGVSATTTGATYVIGITNAASGSVTISNNTIGNMASYGVNTSTNIRGIASTSGTNTISQNTVRDISTPSSNTGTTSSASVIGISMTSTTTGTTVSQNTIFGLSNSHLTAAVCVTGIHYGGSTTGTNVIARNLVYGLSIVSSSASSDMRGINFNSGLARVQNNVIRLGYDASGAALTSGIQITGLFDATSTSGTGMYFNSVYIGGTGVNTVAGNTYAFRSNQTTNTRTYQNNIFYNGRSNATTGGKHYAVMVSGTGLNPAGLALNYNDYLANGTGAVFGYYGADVANFATWQSNVGQDANSINADPLFVAATAATPNLNLSTGSPCESVGLAIGSVTDDYTGASRAGLTPTDIGAYAGLFAPAGIDMKPTAFVSPAASGCYSNTQTVTVTIQNNAGSIIDFTVNPVTVAVAGAGSAAGYMSSTVVNTGTLGVGATMDVDMPATINMFANGTYLLFANTTVTGDVNTANDGINVSRTVSVMGGTYTVGAAGNFTSLTAAVAAYNASTCLTGAVVFSLLDASYSAGETFPITINSHVSASATNTLTIKPAAGVTATISGSNATALLKLNGADYVTIDGSNNGTTTKDLTLSNTITSSSSVIMLSSLGANTGATYNTIKNCNIKAGSITNTTYGIVIGGATVASTGADNDNNTIQNNTITKAYVAIWAQGSATSNPGLMDNLSIAGNTIGSATATDYVSHDGVMLVNATGASVSQNTIFNLIIGSSTPVGITFGTGVVSSSITRNNINNITATGTSGYGGRGIFVNTGNAASSLTISNNLISSIGGDGWTTFSNSSMVGIYLDGTTGGLNLYHNSVYLSGTFTRASATLTTALLLNTATITNVDLRNNIFVNTMDNTGSTTDKNYAIYSTSPNTAFSSINYNNYYVSGAQGVLGYIGSDRTDLAGIVTGFGGNANSVNVDPVFTSTPVILTPTVATLDGTGVNGLVAVDYSNVARSNPPDIGALEFAPPSCNIPTALSYTGVTNNQATLNWTAASPAPGSGYDIYYSTSAIAPDGATTPTTTVAAGIVTYTTPATLTAQTTYYAWVRSNCGAGSTSDWTSSVSFTTLCDAVSSLPWTENFDAMGSIGNSIIPSCWKIESGSGTPWNSGNAGSVTYNDPSSTPNYIYCNYTPSSVDKYIITPGFTLTSGTSYDFNFKYAGDGYAGWTADARYNTSPTGTGSTILGAAFLASGTTSPATYANVTRTFVAPSNGTYYFMVHVNNTSAPYYLGLDDFSLTLTPTCFPPTALTSSAITYTSATVSWTAPASGIPAGYQWEVRSSGAAGSGATGLVASGTTTVPTVSANVTGLTGATTYNYYVRTDCGAGDYSSWANATLNTLSCNVPTAVTSSAVTNSFATISWTAPAVGSPAGYEYEVRTSGAAGSGATGLVTSGTTVSPTVSASISGLSASTAYSVYVRTNCTPGFYSAWTSAYTFTSGCNPYTVLPHTEPFATYLPSTCWSEGDLGNLTTGPTTISATASSWTEDGFLNVGTTGAAKINIDATGDNDWILSPQFTLPATPYQRLKYSVGATQWNVTTAPTNAWEADDYVEVLISTNGATNWTVLKTYNSSNVPSHLGQTDLIDLNTYAGQTIKIAFRGVEGAANGSADIDFFIDNFIIEEMPSCVEPSALSASLINYTSATISWTAPAIGTPIGYEYEVRTSGVAGSGATGLVTSGTTLVPTVSAALTGLNGATTYYYYVRTDCGAGDYSTWASSTFNTLSCNVPTAVSSSAVTTTTATISWTAPVFGTPAGYEYEVRTSGAAGSGATGLFTSGTTTSPTVSANLVGLSSGTNYSIYVRTNCSTGFYSAWTVAVTFSTTCGVATIPYSQNFETATVPAIPICTSIQNAGTGNNWVTVNNPGSGFTSKTLKYGWHASNNANAWFYTQGIQMTAGTSYRITFRYGNNDITYIEKLKVAVGTNPVNTSMTTTLLDFTSINQNAVQNASYDFTVPANGVYYFGFNCYSNFDQFNLYVDDILIDLAPQWTGTVSSDWNTAGNWSAGSVPLAATNVLIPGTYSNAPIVNEDKTTPAVCNNITIENGAVLTIAADKALTVNGNIVNNGTVIVESNASGDGSLITTGTVTGTGIYNVKRYLQESMWHLVTSPITNAQSGVMHGIWLRPYDEATNTFGAYIVPDNIPMTTGQGFSVWTNTANEIRTFAGTVNDGAQGPWNVQLTGAASANTGWNLIGNPYPSAIDWNAASGWTKNSIGGTIYLWNQTQYATFNGTVGTNQGSRYIAMGQGFFVQAAAPGANISLNDNVRVHDAISFRDEVEVPDLIRINIEGNSSSDEAVLYYVSGSNDSYDFDYDATKLYGNSSAPQLYTMKQENMLAINSMSNLETLNGKKVYVEVGQAADYMISYNHNLVEYSNLMMKDLLTNTVIYPNHNYVFAAQPDDDAARFEFFFDVTGNELEHSNEISVWVFDNILHVQIQENQNISNIALYDIQGKLIMTFTDSVKDLSGLAPAVYVVKVAVGDNSVVEKVLVK